jgi:hypothetical protein
MIEIWKKMNSGLAHLSNDLSSGSSERLTTGNSKSDHIFPHQSPSQIWRQLPSKVPFTTESVQTHSKELSLREQGSYTSEFSDNPNMLIGEESSGHSISEPKLADANVGGDVDDQSHNLMGHFKAGDDKGNLANMEPILPGLLI